MRTRLMIAAAALALLVGALPARASGPREDQEMYQAVIDARTRGQAAFRKGIVDEEGRAAEAGRLRLAEVERESAARTERNAPAEEPRESSGFPWVVVAFGCAAGVGILALRRRRNS